jgi:hypothetical protein
MTGSRATWMMTGGLVSLALAADTIWLSIQPEGRQPVTGPPR